MFIHRDVCNKYSRYVKYLKCVTGGTRLYIESDRGATWGRDHRVDATRYYIDGRVYIWARHVYIWARHDINARVYIFGRARLYIAFISHIYRVYLIYRLDRSLK